MQVQTKNDLHVTLISDNEEESRTSDVDESNVVQASPDARDLTPTLHPFVKTSPGDDSVKVEAVPHIASPLKEKDSFVSIGVGLVGKYQTICKKRPVNLVFPLKSRKEKRDEAQFNSQLSKSQNEPSVCLTEENRHVCMINPMKIADKEWTDPYKLNKLLT